LLQAKRTSRVTYCYRDATRIFPILHVVTRKIHQISRSTVDTHSNTNFHGLLLVVTRDISYRRVSAGTTYFIIQLSVSARSFQKVFRGLGTFFFSVQLGLARLTTPCLSSNRFSIENCCSWFLFLSSQGLPVHFELRGGGGGGKE